MHLATDELLSTSAGEIGGGPIIMKCVLSRICKGSAVSLYLLLVLLISDQQRSSQLASAGEHAATLIVTGDKPMTAPRVNFAPNHERRTRGKTGRTCRFPRMPQNLIGNRAQPNSFSVACSTMFHSTGWICKVGIEKKSRNCSVKGVIRLRTCLL